MIIYIAWAYIKCMQSVCRTDTVGRTKFSYPFGSAYFMLETHMPVQPNSMLELVLSFIPAENFVASQMARFWSKMSFHAAEIAPYDFFLK